MYGEDGKNCPANWKRFPKKNYKQHSRMAEVHKFNSSEYKLNSLHTMISVLNRHLWQEQQNKSTEYS